MIRRLLSLALAAVVFGVPVSAEVCQARCAAQEAGPSSGAVTPHHSCHQAAAPQSGTAIAAVHVCGHDDGLATALERVARVTPVPPALLPSTPVPVIAPPFVLRAFARPLDSSPPTPLNLIAQLRV